MNIFQIVPEDFFKPLTSKYKAEYFDCLEMIYETYSNEFSFGVEKEIILGKLEKYFEDSPAEEMVFDEEKETADDPRAKANIVLRTLKDCGWIEFEIDSDYTVKVNLLDHAATIIESMLRIISNEEMEYQSVISQIHGALMNEEGYRKPYEYILKGVVENTRSLITGLKKLNTMIRKRIDDIAREKTAAQIVEGFFDYHREIGSKAYHRIKTSDNISHFRIAIIEKLKYILNDRNVFAAAVSGYMEIESVTDRDEAEELVRNEILYVIRSFSDYDEIIAEIDHKHSKYISGAVARAKFLLNNTSNAEGKLARILAFLAEKYSGDLMEDDAGDLTDSIDIYPQNFVDGDSLYVMPVTRKFGLPQLIGDQFALSEEDRMLRKLAIREANERRFSRKNISNFVIGSLGENTSVLASSLPLESRRDLIRLIFVGLYGRHERAEYHVKFTGEVIRVNGFRFRDFVVVKGGKDGDIQREQHSEG